MVNLKTQPRVSEWGNCALYKERSRRASTVLYSTVQYCNVEQTARHPSTLGSQKMMLVSVNKCSSWLPSCIVYHRISASFKCSILFVYTSQCITCKTSFGLYSDHDLCCGLYIQFCILTLDTHIHHFISHSVHSCIPVNFYTMQERLNMLWIECVWDLRKKGRCWWIWKPTESSRKYQDTNGAIMCFALHGGMNLRPPVWRYQSNREMNWRDTDSIYVLL